MDKKELRVCLLGLMILNFIFTLSGQSGLVTFYVDKTQNCAQVLDDFKKKNNVIIAFNSDLQSIMLNDDRKLVADNLSDLFTKLCHVYGLDFIIHDPKTYLVRSSAIEVQNTNEQSIHLNIKDISTGEPVSFATVYDESGKVYAFTDAYGDCFVKQATSDMGTKLFVHSLSYKDHQINLTKNVNFIPVKLQLDPIKVIPVSIKTLKNKLYFAKTQSIDLDQRGLESVSGASIFSNDVIRNIQILAGVQATNDAKAAIRIRGSNEEATLMLLDEMPIYRADHFYGIFGAFNGDYLDQYALFRNNIPVQYGGRTSGMLRMESQNQIDSAFLKLDANLLNLGIHTAIPLSRNVAVNFAYRKSLANLTNTGFNDLSERENISNRPQDIRNQSLARSNPDFGFYDLNSSIIVKWGTHHLKANVFNSNDVFSNGYMTNFLGRDKAKVQETFNQENQWANSAAGLNYSYTLKQSRLDINTYFTSHSNKYDIISQLTRRLPNIFERDTFAILNNNWIQDYGFKAKFLWEKWWNTYLGAEFVNHANELTLQNENRTIFESNRKGRESALFSGFKWGSNASWVIEPGLRLSYIQDLNKTFLLPQIYTQGTITDHVKVKASASRHLQYIRQIEHENILGQKQSYFVIANDKNIPLGIGQNYMIGTWMGFGAFSMDVEAYYRKLDGTIIHATVMPGFRKENTPLPASSFKVFSGETLARGIDFTFTFLNERYSSLLTYTLSKTENRFPEIFQNQFFPASEDSRHQIKFAHMYAIKRWEISTQYVGATGRPYFDLTGLNTGVLRENLDVNQYISILPAYHRWDIGAAYKTVVRKQAIKIGFSIFNVFDRNNVKFRQFVFQLPPAPGSNNAKQTVLGNDVEQLGRTLNISIGLDIR